MTVKVILTSGTSTVIENVFSVTNCDDSIQVLYSINEPCLNRIQCAIYEYRHVSSITCM